MEGFRSKRSKSSDQRRTTQSDNSALCSQGKQGGEGLVLNAPKRARWGNLRIPWYILILHSLPTCPQTVITSLRASLSKGKCAGPNIDTNGKLLRTTHGCKIPLVRTLNYDSVGVSLDLSPCWNSTIIYKFKSSTWEDYCTWAANMCQLKHFPSAVVCHERSTIVTGLQGEKKLEKDYVLCCLHKCVQN